MNSKIKEWSAFALLSLIWGSSFLWIKIGVQPDSEPLQNTKYFLPMWLVSFRVLFGFLAVAAVFIFQRRQLPRERNLWLGFAVMGVVNTVIPFVLITWGEASIDSGVASILNGTVPLFVIILGNIFLPDEKMTLQKLGGLLMGFVGMIVLVWRDLDPQKILNSNVLGQLAVVVACISYASALIFSRRYLRGQNPTVQSTLSLFFANLVMWIITPSTQPISTLPTYPLTWFAVAWLGVLGLCVAYLLFFYINNAWGPTRSSLVTYMMPVVGVILGAIFLREPLDIWLVLGAVLIVSGIVIVNLKH